MNLSLLLLIFFAFSCAKPHYVDPAGIEQNNQTTKACPHYFQEENLCLSMKWTTFPSQEETGTFVMKFYEEGTPERPVTPRLTPAVLLWMPSMGHGSSPVIIKQLADNTFEVSDIYFIMLGEWDIRFQLKDNNDVIEEHIQKITL